MSLPTIVMPEPVPEPEVFPAKSAKIIDNVENRVSEEEAQGSKEQPDMVVEDISSDEEQREPPAEPDKEEDVFKEAPSIKQVVEEEEEIPEVPEKKPRKKYERKKEMSQKQKDHLAKIRKIASEKRRIAREEKAKLKEEADIKKAEEKIKKKQEKEEQDAKDKLKAEHEENLKIASQARYSQVDLEEAMINAVSTYDTLRKERKVLKKKQQAEEAQRNAQKNMISRAIQPQKYADPSQTAFSHCFM